MLREPNVKLWQTVCATLRQHNVEFRRGTAGGGNMLRQPFLREFVAADAYKQYPNVEHVHKFGLYIGNYPSLDSEKILALCEILNKMG